jgi:hypothetical protein
LTPQKQLTQFGYGFVEEVFQRTHDLPGDSYHKGTGT